MQPCSECNITFKFKTYTIPDALQVLTNTGDVIIDTGLISTGDNFNIYGPMLIDACDLSVCLDAPNGGTAWVLEVESDCGATLSEAGGQNIDNNPYCWFLNPVPTETETETIKPPQCPTSTGDCAQLGGAIISELCYCLEGPGGAYPDLIERKCKLPPGCECPPSFPDWRCQNNNDGSWTITEYVPDSCASLGC